VDHCTDRVLPDQPRNPNPVSRTDPQSVETTAAGAGQHGYGGQGGDGRADGWRGPPGRD
jgi:hypothetical protein